MADKINSKLTNAFNPTILDVRDDSHHHAGHMGARPEGETHFHITISSPIFKNKSKIQQHRMIFDILKQELSNGLHALQIKVVMP